jgi:tetratricopeptide (TPR) repeat protein
MLGGAYFYEKKYAEAEMVYERLIISEPGSGMLSIALFNSLWKQGRHEEAADEIRRFISVADKVQERDTLEKYAEISKAISEQ